jgi:hypothetical protein
VTIIRDDNGTRWVEMPVRKRRAPARALRFAYWHGQGNSCPAKDARFDILALALA